MQEISTFNIIGNFHMSKIVIFVILSSTTAFDPFELTFFDFVATFPLL